MNHQSDLLAAEKNLHAAIPSALLYELEKTAQAEHVTLDEVMRQAGERFIEERRWKDLYAFGEKQVYKLGIKKSDVERIIHQRRKKELECATVAKSDYIVTGDKKHILPLGSYGAAHIVKVADFLRLLEGEASQES